MIFKRPILVTGSHRSGSTWVGKMIAESPSVCYIQEPFNLTRQPCSCGVKFDYWFQYISDENASIFHEHVQHAIGLSYNFRKPKSLKDVLRLVGDYCNFLFHRVSVRPLVKDPIAVFSAEWLAATFDMDVILLIRHPAAFAGSLKRLNWPHPFSHFLDQPLLMRDHLYPFEAEIREYAEKEQDIVDQAALLWKLIYHMVLKYQKNHRDWVFIRHEDLSRDPLSGFQTLFNKLNLALSEHIREVIREHSDPANPNQASRYNSIQLDSKSNLSNWRNRLTESEVERIRTQVEDVSSAFYSDEDWR
jgi:hypothetical protein